MINSHTTSNDCVLFKSMFESDQKDRHQHIATCIQYLFLDDTQEPEKKNTTTIVHINTYISRISTWRDEYSVFISSKISFDVGIFSVSSIQPFLLCSHQGNGCGFECDWSSKESRLGCRRSCCINFSSRFERQFHCCRAIPILTIIHNRVHARGSYTFCVPSASQPSFISNLQLWNMLW